MAILLLIMGLILFLWGLRTNISLNKPMADTAPAEFADAREKRIVKTTMLIAGVFLVALAVILSATSFFIVG